MNEKPIKFDDNGELLAEFQGQMFVLRVTAIELDLDEIQGGWSHKSYAPGLMNICVESVPIPKERM